MGRDNPDYSGGGGGGVPIIQILGNEGVFSPLEMEIPQQPPRGCKLGVFTLSHQRTEWETGAAAHRKQPAHALSERTSLGGRSQIGFCEFMSSQSVEVLATVFILGSSPSAGGSAAGSTS